MSAYDQIIARVEPGSRFQTPDSSTGKPFVVESIDSEALLVRTVKGGRVKISLFAFDTAVKYLDDLGCRDDHWLEVKDMMFQSLLNLENDRVRASSYILGILGGAGLIEIDGRRPNKVRLI